MKPGHKTTEFWIAIAGVGGIFAKFVMAHCTADVSDLSALVLLIAAYIGGRSWLKAKVNNP